MIMVFGVTDVSAVPYLRRRECRATDTVFSLREGFHDQRYRAVLIVRTGSSAGVHVIRRGLPPVLEVVRLDRGRPLHGEAAAVRALVDSAYRSAALAALLEMSAPCQLWRAACSAAWTGNSPTVSFVQRSFDGATACAPPRGTWKSLLRARAVLAIACRTRIGCDLVTAAQESGVSMRAFRRWSISAHDDGPQARARLRPRVLIAEMTREMSQRHVQTAHALGCRCHGRRT